MGFGKSVLVFALLAGGIVLIGDETFPGWRERLLGTRAEGGIQAASEDGTPASSEETLRVLVLSYLVNESPDAPGDVTRLIHQSDNTAAIMQTVTEALRHTSSLVRRNAAAVCGLMHWTETRRALEGPVQDSVPEVRRAVVAALRHVGDERSLFALVLALKDGHWSVRAEAAEALGVCCGAKALPYLWTALGDSDSLVRDMARESLVRVAQTEHRQFLEDHSADPNPFKRETAGLALRKIDGLKDL